MRMSKALNMVKKSEVYKNIIIAYGDILNTIQKVLTSTIILLFLCHLIVCLRMTFAKTGLKGDYETWWTVYCSKQNLDPLQDSYLIFISWQWAVQTVTTVGQGDIPNHTEQEMLFCLITMVVGVGVFGDFVGAVTGMETQDLMIEEDRVRKEEIIKNIKAKQQIAGASLVQLDYVLSKLNTKGLAQEYRLINKLNQDKSRQVFDNIKESLGG